MTDKKEPKMCISLVKLFCICIGLYNAQIGLLTTVCI